VGNLVKTVTLQITGDIKDAAAKVGLIRKDWRDLADKSPLELKAELTGSEEVKARLKEIEARAEKLKEEFPEFAVKIDIGAASAKLAVLRAEIRKTADTGRSLSDRISGIGAALGKATPAWTGFLAAGLALGPALLPVLAAVTGGVLGMGAALAGAGAGVGIFAFAATSNLSELQKQLLKVQAANLAANKALQTAAKNRTQAQDQAIVKAKMLTAAFNKEFGAEADAIEKLKSSWLSFTTQPVVTNAIAAGARLLTAVLPHLTPLLKLGADAVQAFAGALAGFTVGGGLDKLVAGLVKMGKVGLGGFLAVLHNLAVAFGALSGGAGNFAAGVIGGLVKLSAAFASWAQNKGPGALSGLMDTIRKLGPGVLSLITSLAAAVPALAQGLFPLAPVSLALATSLAKLIKNTPPGVITAIAVAFVAWTVAAKGLMAAGALGDAWKAVVKFSAVTKGATIAETIAAAATRAWGLAMDALPWVALAAAVVTVAVLIIKYHKQIWAFVQRVWDDILAVIRGVWNWIKGHWPLLLEIITGPFGLAVVFIARHWTTIKDGARAVIGFFRDAWQGIAHLMEAPFQAAVKVIKGIWKTILGFWHTITSLGGGGGPVPGGRGHGMGPTANSQLAKRIMPAWSTGANWAAWNAVATRESGWNNFALNQSSGAYGIPQALPPTKMPFAAQAAGGSDAATQIGWMVRYMAGRYGGPQGAWAHEVATGWYDSGAQYLPPGLSMALNTTGRPERVGGEDLAPLLRENNMLLRKLPGVLAMQLGRVQAGRPVAPRPSVFAAR
jgi:phage-related protein